MRGGDNMYRLQFSLRELRARKNETQKDVAAAIGISDYTYYRIENDVKHLRSTKIDVLLRLAEHFDVSVGEIFLG